MSVQERLDLIQAELLEILQELQKLGSTTTGEGLKISSGLNRQAATTRVMDEYHPIYPASTLILSYDDLLLSKV